MKIKLKKDHPAYGKKGSKHEVDPARANYLHRVGAADIDTDGDGDIDDDDLTPEEKAAKDAKKAEKEAEKAAKEADKEAKRLEKEKAEKEHKKEKVENVNHTPKNEK